MRQTLYYYLLFALVFGSQCFAQQYEVAIQSGHSKTLGQYSAVTAIRYSDDGKYLVTGGNSGNAILWEIATGRQVRSFGNSSENIQILDLTPDNQHLFIQPGYDVPTIMNTITGEEGARMRYDKNNLTNWYSSARYDHHANQLLIVGENILVYNTLNWQILRKGDRLPDINNSFATSAISPDKKHVVVGYEYGQINIHDGVTLNKVKSLAKHKEWIDKIAFSADGSVLVVVSIDLLMRVYDVKNDFKLQNEYQLYKFEKGAYRTSGMTGAIVLSNDGKYAAIAMKTYSNATGYSLYLYDLGTGTQVHQFRNRGANTNAMALSPDGKTLAIGMDSGNSQVVFFDLMTGEEVAGISTYTNEAPSMDIANNEMIISNDQGLHVFDLSTGRKIKLRGMQGYSNVWKAHFDGEFIKANARTAWSQYSTQKNVQIKLKFHNGAYEFVQQVDQTDDFLRVMRIDGKTYYLYQDHIARIDAASNRRDTVKFSISGYPQDVVFSTSGKHALKMGQPPYEQYKWVSAGIGKKTVKKTVDVVKDAASLIDVFSLKRDAYIEYPMNYLGPYHTGVSVTDDGKYFFDSPSVYEVKTNDVVFTIPGDEIQTRVYTSMFTREGGKLLVFYQNNTVKCFEVPSGKLLKEFKGKTGVVFDVKLSDDEASVFVLNKDASVQRWDTNSGLLIVTYYPFEGDNYAVIWSDNYYMMSPAAYKHLHYVNGLKTIGFENFDLVYNRPDIITKRSGSKDETLINGYYKAYLKRLQKMGFGESQISKEMKLPEVKLLTTDLPLKTSEQSIEISFEASGNGIPLDRLNVYVNNVPLFGMRGKAITKGLMSVNDKITIPLSAGKNKIEVSVHNTGGYESPRQIFNIAKEGGVKPDLYIVAIGVSDYKDNNYDLTYAAKDAQDLIKAYQGRTSQYGNITVMEFTDTKATRENILKAKETLLKTKVDDQVVLFAAGHGLVDTKLDYYFATHDVNFVNPALRGLAYDALEALLDGIPARKKLMLIDACHSGEIDKEESQLLASITTSSGVKSRGFKTVAKKNLGLSNSFDVMNEIFADLRRGTGAVVISSASGVEFAFESAQWKNGVFTYSLLEAFRVTDADKNKTGSIEVSELKDYVIQKVTTLTNGKQHPTSRRENLDFDFVVW